jgi:hypothetical protein
LIRALGSVDAIRWLAHRPLITLLYRLAERSGMSWQKSQSAAGFHAYVQTRQVIPAASPSHK